MTIEPLGDIHNIRISDLDNHFLFCSDIHFDSKKCDRKLLKKHFDKIKQLNGGILIFGDVLDVMGAEKDPRSKSSDIRPEYLKDGAYLDLVIKDAYEFFKNYPILFISYGNHETGIIKHRDTDPLARLVDMLNANQENKIQLGKYQGFIKFSYKRTKEQQSLNLAYHHGHGGGQRSKGVLHSQLDAFKYPNSDVIVSGHTHGKIHDPSNVGYVVNQKGIIKEKVTHWLKLGSYKKYSFQSNDWEVQKGFMPVKLGSYFCNFKPKYSEGGFKGRDIIFTEAT